MTLNLPWPPSMNHYYAVVRGRKITSKHGREYHQAVAGALLQAGTRPFDADARLMIEIRAYPPDRRRRDLDNLAKPVLDSLQKAGLFPDDSQVDILTLARRAVESPGRVSVSVAPLEVR